MNIFGKSRKRPSNDQIPFGITPDGDIDFKNRRLRHVKDGAQNDDAATVTRLYYVALTIHGRREYYDCRNKRLSNLADPVKDSDCVNLKYLGDFGLVKKPFKLSGGKNDVLMFNARNIPINNVGPPVTQDCALSLSHLSVLLLILHSEMTHELADLSIALRREMYNIKRKSTKPVDQLTKELNDIESSIHKNWRQALEENAEPKTFFSLKDIGKNLKWSPKYAEIFEKVDHFGDLQTN